jgi:Protein of unknown function (DUF3102)
MLDRISQDAPLIAFRSPRRPNHKLINQKYQQRLADLTARFKNAMRKSIEGIIEAGQILQEAKDSLEHGQWLFWLENHLQFDVRQAQMLIFLSKNPVLSNACNYTHLPVSPRTLWELSQMPKQRLVKLIADGTINQSTRIEDAVALRRHGIVSQERLATPKLKREIATLVNACLAIGGADVVLAYIRSLEDMSNIAPTVKELQQAALWAKQKIGTRQKKRS